jgi:hypothetical protein
MLEVGLICIIALAVGYWVTLWLMGRRDDVLHGDFVHEEAGSKADAKLPVAPFPPPPFPKKPRIVRPEIVRFDAAGSEAAPESITIVAKPSRANGVLPRNGLPLVPDQSDTLNTLLASIKRDLKDASQL